MNPQPTASTPTLALAVPAQPTLFSPALLPRKLPVFKQGPEDELPTLTRH